MNTHTSPEDLLLKEVHRILSASTEQPDHTQKELISIVCALIESHYEEGEQQENSAVNHPQHYRPGTYEAIEVIQAWNLNFALGNSIKYICRAGLKDPSKTIEDLEKAANYIQLEIKHRLKTLAQ